MRHTHSRVFMLFLAGLLILPVLVACGGAQPEAVERIVEQTVVVEQTVEVEREVVVEQTVEVAREVVVTAPPEPGPALDSEVLRVAMPDLAAEIEFDPHFSPFVPAQPVMSAVYETLVEYDPATGEIVAGLAESWEVSDDGSVITFNLRPGATFSTGNPVTADAVVWSLQRPFNSEAYLLYVISGFLNAESAEALDESTVQVTLNEPSAAALAGFASFATAIIDPAVMEEEVDGDFGYAYLNRASMGSGPYMIETVALGEQVSLVPNPHYNGRVPAQLGRIILLNVPESSQQLFMLERGDVDVATALTPQQTSRILANPGFQAITGEDTAVSYLSLNMGREPFDDVRVRQAVCSAIDYEGIYNGLLPDQVLPASGIIPRGLVGYTDRFMPTTDLEQARSLLEEAGYADGFEFDIWVTTEPIRGLSEPEANIALKIQSDLAPLGIKANVQQQEISTLFPRYQAGELDSIWWDWSPLFPDPDPLITPHGDLTTSGAQRTGWGCDAGTAGNGCPQENLREEAQQATELIALARTELDSDQRAALYEQAQEIIVNEGPYCFFFQALSTHVASDRVENYVRHPFFVVDLRPVNLAE